MTSRFLAQPVPETAPQRRPWAPVRPGSTARLGASGDHVEHQAELTAGRLAAGAPRTEQWSAQSDGAPLAPATRAYFEAGLGANLAGVRVHADRAAQQAAHSYGARAFTIGRHIALGPGHADLEPPARTRLLAHELAHVAQARLDPAGAPVIRRQTRPDPAGSPAVGSTPLINVPGTGITLLPSPLRLQSVLGQRIPLPAALRATNALSAGGGPSYVLDFTPRQIIATMLGNVDLSTSDLPGTPPGQQADEAHQSRVSLTNTILTLDTATGRIVGTATLHWPSGYPTTLRPPTELAVRIESTELPRFRGRISFGPLLADFSVRLHYDLPRLDSAVQGAFAPAGGLAGFWQNFSSIVAATVPGARLTGARDAIESVAREVIAGRVQGAEFARRALALLASSVPPTADLAALRSALAELAEELSHPGFSASGTVRLGIPLTRFRMEAPTTRPLDRPLLGAPTAYPSTIEAGGVVLAPPGAVTSVAAPALGYTYSSFDARSGVNFTAAALPTLSPETISAGGPAQAMFPVHAFVEFSYVRRIGSTVDIGVRATAQVSTGDIGTAPPTDAATPIPSTERDRSDSPAAPNVGIGVFGSF